MGRVTERRPCATLNHVAAPDEPDPVDHAFDVDEFSRRVAEAEQRVRLRVPEIHPFDLHTILHAMLMPLERRAFFLRRRKDGGYEF